MGDFNVNLPQIKTTWVVIITKEVSLLPWLMSDLIVGGTLWQQPI